MGGWMEGVHHAQGEEMEVSRGDGKEGRKEWELGGHAGDREERTQCKLIRMWQVNTLLGEGIHRR